MPICATYSHVVITYLLNNILYKYLTNNAIETITRIITCTLDLNGMCFHAANYFMCSHCGGLQDNQKTSNECVYHARKLKSPLIQM